MVLLLISVFCADSNVWMGICRKKSPDIVVLIPYKMGSSDNGLAMNIALQLVLTKQSFLWKPGLPPINFIVGLTMHNTGCETLHKHSDSFFLSFSLPEKMGFISLVLSTRQASRRAFTGLEDGEVALLQPPSHCYSASKSLLFITTCICTL